MAKLRMSNEDLLRLIPLLQDLKNPEVLNSIPADDPLMKIVMRGLAEDKKLGRLLWIPTPKQKLLVETAAYETLYGGGRGGGKTFGLLAIARNNHRRSLILRRTFPQLEGSLIDDSKRLFNSQYYNLTRHVWEFPDNCLIRFGHVQNADDMYAYDGSQYDLLGFDQLEQFTYPSYQHLLAVTRTNVPNQRVRVIATANPVGEGVSWVIERWAAWLDRGHPNPAKPGEIRWFARIEGKDTEVENGEPFLYKGELIEPRSRTFIPALIVDNPHLNKDYVATLQSFPEPLRSQLLYGLWNAGDTDDPYQVIKRGWVDLAMKRWTEECPFPKDPLAMGVDVARGGEDKTVISRCRRTWFDRLIVKMGVETPDGKSVATLVVNELKDGGNTLIDLVGWGSSAYDQLKDSGYPVFGMNGSETSEATDRGGQVPLANRRTEVYWKLREALDPAYGIDIRLPPDDELRSELCAPHWEYMSGKIRVEPKEKTIERSGHSPNKADAVAYAWSMSQMGVMSRTAIIPNHEYVIGDE